MASNLRLGSGFGFGMLSSGFRIQGFGLELRVPDSDLNWVKYFGVVGLGLGVRQGLSVP